MVPASGGTGNIWRKTGSCRPLIQGRNLLAVAEALFSHATLQEHRRTLLQVVRPIARPYTYAGKRRRFVEQTCTLANVVPTRTSRMSSPRCCGKYPDLSHRDPLEAQLATALNELSSQRSQSWTQCCKEQWTRLPGCIFRYVKSYHASHSLQMLHHGQQCPPVTLTDRVDTAV